MHETSRHSTCNIFMRLVSRRTNTSACHSLWFNRGPSCAWCTRVLLARVLVSSHGIVVWCVGRWTHRGIVMVATTVSGVVSYSGYWCTAACGFSSSCEAGCVSVLVVLSVGFSSSCEGGRVSALVVLIVFASCLWEAGRDSQHLLS